MQYFLCFFEEVCRKIQIIGICWGISPVFFFKHPQYSRCYYILLHATDPMKISIKKSQAIQWSFKAIELRPGVGLRIFQGSEVPQELSFDFLEE